MTHQAAPELLPCPFCGGDAKLKWRKLHPAAVQHWITCTKCHVKTPMKRDKPNEDWNTRAAQPPKKKTVSFQDGDRVTEFVISAPLVYIDGNPYVPQPAKLNCAELEAAIKQADESCKLYKHSAWVLILLEAARARLAGQK
jgi:hypothetical protein